LTRNILQNGVTLSRQVSRLSDLDLDFRFWIEENSSFNPKSKIQIQNRFHCGATVRAFHPASPFVSLLEKARPRAFETEKYLFVNRKLLRKTRERQVITLQKKMSKHLTSTQTATFLNSGSLSRL
jgi:hypothetical protein